MRSVLTAGGVIVSNGKILLIRHRSGGLAFAKGHVEDNESPEDAALREVEEETGCKATIVGYLGSLERTSIETTGEKVKKKVKIYKMVKISGTKRETDETPEWIETDRAVNEMQFKEEAEFLNRHIDELSR